MGLEDVNRFQQRLSDRLEDVARIQHGQGNTLQKIMAKQGEHDIMLKQDGAARTLFQRMTVSLRDPSEYDHDTLVLFPDQSRFLLRELVEAASKQAAHRMVDEERRKLFKTWKGRISAGVVLAGGALDLCLNLWRSFKGH